MCVCARVYVHACLCARVYVCARLCGCVCVCVHVCVCVCVHMCVGPDAWMLSHLNNMQSETAPAVLKLACESGLVWAWLGGLGGQYIFRVTMAAPYFPLCPAGDQSPNPSQCHPHLYSVSHTDMKTTASTTNAVRPTHTHVQSLKRTNPHSLTHFLCLYHSLCQFN